jgi:CubicO group peptidase (beta-lactamase class C family)
MKTLWLAGGAAALAIATVSGAFGQAVVSPPVQDVAVAADAVPALARAYVADRKTPGIVIAYAKGDRPPNFAAAGTIADDEGAAKADADSLWRVYSMTKPVTGIAAMLLVEDGKLRLDQPISDFIPGFRNMRVLTDPANSLASRPATRPITVRHLVTHTAGLGYNIITKGPLLKEYERLGLLPGAVSAQVEAQAKLIRPKSLQEFANRTATLPLIADPGTKWSYSIGLDVMGAVIEKASGMSFEAFLQRRLFTPLGMRSSYWTVPASEVGRFATNYAFAGDRRVPLDPAATSAWLQPPSFPYGGAGLVMSARDYDRFLHMLQEGGTLNGVRVAKPETVRTMMSDLLPAGVTFAGIGGTTGGTQAQAPMGYGAGGSVYLADAPGGFSKGTYGWGGAAGTIGFVDPARKLRGTLMVNYFPADRWPVRTELSKALAEDAARFMR